MFYWVAQELITRSHVLGLTVDHEGFRRLHSSAAQVALCSTLLRCWGRLATESPGVLAEHMEQISPLLLAATNAPQGQLATLAVEFWSSLALQDWDGLGWAARDSCPIIMGS